MKIYKSNYRNHWISPYTILEKVFFWKELDYDDPLVEKWSDRLTPISKGIQFVLDAVHPQISYVKIDRYDTWNMDSTLATIILPMLIQLKNTKHGSPFVNDDDVPKTLRSTTRAAIKSKTNEWDTDCNHHRRWDWVLSEMIWAFEQLQPDCDWESKYHKGKIEFKSTPIDAKGNEVPKDQATLYRLDRGPNDTSSFDKVGYEKHQKRITNGLRLFGTYYQGLWD